MSFAAVFREGLQRDRFRAQYGLNISMLLVYSNKPLSFSTLPHLIFISTISKPQKHVNICIYVYTHTHTHTHTDAFPVIYLVNK